MIAFRIRRHEQIPQMLRRETIMWKHLKHPKISPLLVSHLQVIFGWVSGEELHQEKRWRRPTCTCACPSCCSYPIPTPATSSPRSQRASTTFTRVMRLTEIPREYVVVPDHISPLRWHLVGMTYLYTLLTTVPPLKHRWLRSC